LLPRRQSTWFTSCGCGSLKGCAGTPTIRTCTPVVRVQICVPICPCTRILFHPLFTFSITPHGEIYVRSSTYEVRSVQQWPYCKNSDASLSRYVNKNASPHVQVGIPRDPFSAVRDDPFASSRSGMGGRIYVFHTALQRYLRIAIPDVASSPKPSPSATTTKSDI
jgi:hypothetical protein